MPPKGAEFLRNHVIMRATQSAVARVGVRSWRSRASEGVLRRIGASRLSHYTYVEAPPSLSLAPARSVRNEELAKLGNGPCGGITLHTLQ